MSTSDDLIREIYTGYAREPALRGLRGKSILPPKVILGDGPVPPRAVLLGEAPGATEVRAEMPFVGAAGQLLGRLLEHHSIERGDLWVTNAVKIRPLGNRTPEDEELDASRPYLMRELEVVGREIPQPRILVAMGATAATIIVDRRVAIGSLAGLVKDVVLPGSGQWKVLFTCHPAAALRSNASKMELRAGLGQLKGMLDGG